MTEGFDWENDFDKLVDLKWNQQECPKCGTSSEDWEHIESDMVSGFAYWSIFKCKKCGTYLSSGGSEG